MARPKKPQHERRDQQMKFVVTGEERAEIEQAAASRGLRLSEFFRRRSMGVRLPASGVDRQQAAEATVALLRLGVNLNQIAKHVNAGRTTPVAELSDIIARINSTMDMLHESGGINPRP